MQVEPFLISQRLKDSTIHYYAERMWPEHTMLGSALIVQSPPGLMSIDKNGHLNVNVENGHATYKLSERQNGPELTWTRIGEYSFSEPPATIKDPGHSQQFF